jgi:hypothetical protein
MLNRIKLQILLAFFWFSSAYLAMGALVPWEWAWRCGLINLILGMIGLLLITRSKRGDRLFYGGPKGDEPSLLQIGLLWAFPIVGLILSIIWWSMRVLGLFDW